jgi:hypothetical protein
VSAQAPIIDLTGIAWRVKVYAVSFAGILALGFLLAVSLVISTGLAAFSSWISDSAGEGILLAIELRRIARRADDSLFDAVQVVSR